MQKVDGQAMGELKSLEPLADLPTTFPRQVWALGEGAWAKDLGDWAKGERAILGDKGRPLTSEQPLSVPDSQARGRSRPASIGRGRTITGTGASVLADDTSLEVGKGGEMGEGDPTLLTHASASFLGEEGRSARGDTPVGDGSCYAPGQIGCEPGDVARLHFNLSKAAYSQPSSLAADIEIANAVPVI
jgi:hypothetical protein